MRRLTAAIALALLALGAGCKSDKLAGVDVPLLPNCLAFKAVASVFAPLGCADVTQRYTGEIATRGTIAYTTTWGGSKRVAGVPGNQVNVWDVSGATPALIDSIIVADQVGTIGDVAVTDDGKYLVVATEYSPGRIVIYDLTNPRHPVEVGRFGNADTGPGVHTAEIGRVNGRQYAFLSVDRVQGQQLAKIVIVDITNPSAPTQIFAKEIGNPYVHDVFLRSGILFLALWNDGVQIWDVGGGGRGGTPAAPVTLGQTATAGGSAHNVWWFHDPSTGSKKYAFVGEERCPCAIGSSSTGDIHVLDVSDMTAPREVAFYHVDGAGPHNFTADEPRGILYAAYYNGGVRAIDARGDLGSCTAAQKSGDGRCDLKLMGRELGVALIDQASRVYVWGVEYRDGFVYASDMLNGIWKLGAINR